MLGFSDRIVIVLRRQGRREDWRLGAAPTTHGAGEMALLDGLPRSADVIADVPVVCYGFVVEELRTETASRPQVMLTIFANLARDLSERLRAANQHVRAMESWADVVAGPTDRALAPAGGVRGGASPFSFRKETLPDVSPLLCTRSGTTLISVKVVRFGDRRSDGSEQSRSITLAVAIGVPE